LILNSIVQKYDVRDIFIVAILFVASFPPSPFGFLIYFALVPLISICFRNSPSESFKIGYTIGLLVNILSYYWLIEYSLFSFSVMILLNACHFAIFGYVQSYFFNIKKQYGLLVFPFIWTGMEYLRQFGDIALPYLNIAYTQTYYLSLIQVADITGYLGITFWICCVNILFFYLWQYRGKIKQVLILIIAGFGILWIYGTIKLQPKTYSERLSIACIQPNFKTRYNWTKELAYKNIDTLLNYTNSIIENPPEVIIWPETSVPYHVRSDTFMMGKLKSHVSEYRYHLIFGTQDFTIADQDTLRHNSVFLLSPDSDSVQFYHKMRLVPKEEGFPFAEYLSWLIPKEILLGFLKPGKVANIFTLSKSAEKNQAGTGTSTKDSRKIRIGTLICYESILPEQAREYRNRNCELIVVITNDAWFGKSAQPFFHLQTAVYRAIENRISIVQSANSGVSGYIDPDGRVLMKTDIFTRSVSRDKLPLVDHDTIYSKIGDLPGIISLIMVLFFYIYRHVGMKRGSN
jgi:apolipoprotein N-acyltransferase